MDKTLTADNAIYNYEWFKKQYAEIQSAELQAQSTAALVKDYMESMPSSRSEWTFEDKTEAARLNSVRI